MVDWSKPVYGTLLLSATQKRKTTKDILRSDVDGAVDMDDMMKWRQKAWDDPECGEIGREWQVDRLKWLTAREIVRRSWWGVEEKYEEYLKRTGKKMSGDAVAYNFSTALWYMSAIATWHNRKEIDNITMAAIALGNGFLLRRAKRFGHKP